MPWNSASASHVGLIVWLGFLRFAIGTEARGEEIDFVRDVRPIFQKHCYSCHADEKQKSGLRLDIKSEAFRGGDGYGPSIVANEVADSPIIEFVTSEDSDSRMPPEGDGLSASEIRILTKWIEQGAIWPDGVDLAKLEDRTDHWSFKPISQPEAPTNQDPDWARNDIDRFILARLESEGLRPASEATRLSWIRRAYFDLHGLPPSPEAVHRFINDKSGEAYERVVDELLASPHYGEHWGQHWLDVVRYADTHGFEVNTPRPNAWPYRDYVIRALNQDIPYDQFIREQLAGDATKQDAATGFLVTAAALLPGQIGKDEPSKRLARQDELAEIIINTGEAFLGLSIGCARCHDHKFDAIPQVDYYSMQAFFSGVKYGERPLRSEIDQEKLSQIRSLESQIAKASESLNDAQEQLGVQATNPRENELKFDPLVAKLVRFSILDANHHPSLGLIEPCIDEFEIFAADEATTNVALASHGTSVTASGSRTSDKHRLEHIHDGKYGNSHSWMSDEAGRGWVLFEFPTPVRIDRIVWSRDREGKFDDRLATVYSLEAGPTLDSMQRIAGLTQEQHAALEDLQAEKKKLEDELAVLGAVPVVFAGVSTTPEPVHLLARGDAEQPLEIVPPAVLSAIGDVQLPTDAPDLARRQALADWIASEQNPLTARVFVNRVWQWHFGTGLVQTASDFGRSGARPTHPQLLDWLANEFIQAGWSTKELHRRIMLSSTYRQSSEMNAVAATQDAACKLLWRFPPRRLEAEAIRDSMLHVSGRLDCSQGGPGFDLFESRGGLSGFPPIESFSGDGLRRMIYAHKIRMEREAVFGAFDCPDAGQSTARRKQSTTPIQALNLFNSRFTIEESDAFAKRIATAVGEDISCQIELAFELAYGRKPQPIELEEAATVVREHGLATLCRVIFNSNEFLFIP